MKEEGGYSSGEMFLSFLLGGLIGAGLALLLAPQSGRETRQKIRDITGDVKRKATDYVEKAKEEVTSTITSAIEAGKEAYEKEKERLSQG